MLIAACMLPVILDLTASGFKKHNVQLGTLKPVLSNAKQSYNVLVLNIYVSLSHSISFELEWLHTFHSSKVRIDRKIVT